MNIFVQTEKVSAPDMIGLKRARVSSYAACMYVVYRLSGRMLQSVYGAGIPAMMMGFLNDAAPM